MFLAGANGERHKPSPTQIELVKSEWDSVLWDCPDCPTSTGLSVKCGTSVPYNTSIHCVVCELGKTYSNTHGYETCKDCHVCKENQVNVSGKCTLEEDTTKCRCKHGYYEGEDGDCKMNATIRPLVITPAGRDTTAHISANKSTYAVISVSSVIGTILVIVFFLLLWHKCPAFKQMIRSIRGQHSAGASSAEQSEGLLPTTVNQSPEHDVPSKIIVVSGSDVTEADCDLSTNCKGATPELHLTAADDHVQGTAQEGVEVPEGNLIMIDDNSPKENATQCLAPEPGPEPSLDPTQRSGMSWNLCNILNKNSTVVIHSESEIGIDWNMIRGWDQSRFLGMDPPAPPLELTLTQPPPKPGGGEVQLIGM